MNCPINHRRLSMLETRLINRVKIFSIDTRSWACFWRDEKLGYREIEIEFIDLKKTTNKYEIWRKKNNVCMWKPVSDLKIETIARRARVFFYCFCWFLDNAYCCRWNEADDCLAEWFNCSAVAKIDGDCGDGERRVNRDWGSSLSFIGGGADDETVCLMWGTGGVEEWTEIYKGAVRTMAGEWGWDDEDEDEEFEIRFRVVGLEKGKYSVGNTGDNGSSKEEVVRSKE